MATAALPYFYQTEVEWTEQRKGDLESPGLATLQVASPPELTEVLVKPKLVVRRSEDLQKAHRLLEKAEKNCLISNSIKSAVRLEPEMVKAAA